MADIFKNLNAVDVNEHVEKKGKFNYLTWAWAWAEVAKRYEDVTYRVLHNPNGWNYFTDNSTGWVETEVTIDGKTIPMQMPIMDFNNKSLPIEKITSFDVNKAIMRCLTKNLSMFGLGLYIYSGEDLPEATEEPQTADKPKASNNEAKNKKPQEESKSFVMCADCGKPIVDIVVNGKEWKRKKIAEHSMNSYGRCLCYECAVKQSREKAKQNG